MFCCWRTNFVIECYCLSATVGPFSKMKNDGGFGQIPDWSVKPPKRWDPRTAVLYTYMYTYSDGQWTDMILTEMLDVDITHNTSSCHHKTQLDHIRIVTSISTDNRTLNRSLWYQLAITLPLLHGET